jgi:hypothetical protein
MESRGERVLDPPIPVVVDGIMDPAVGDVVGVG